MRTSRSTPAKRGPLYSHAESRRPVDVVSPWRAKDLLFTGRGIETEKALAIGPIDRRIETAFEEIVVGYAVAAGLSVETRGYRALAKWAAPGRDCAEGRAAFAEKRTARFAFRGPIAPLERR
jgi:enoyl-CoA hydratase/carnithine racemase